MSLKCGDCGRVMPPLACGSCGGRLTSDTEEWLRAEHASCSTLLSDADSLLSLLWYRHRDRETTQDPVLEHDVLAIIAALRAALRRPRVPETPAIANILVAHKETGRK